MSMRTGALGWSTWTARCDDLKAVFATITGMTLISDTGTGNSRVLLYSVPGTNKYLKLYLTTNQYMNVLKIDNATDLATNVVTTFGQAVDYRIIENGNLVMFVEHLGTNFLGFFWSTTGATNRFFLIGPNNYQIHSTADVAYAAPMSALKITSALPTATNKQLVFPYYPYDNSSAAVCEYPLDNVYIFGNKDAIANNSLLTINSEQYLTINTNGLIKIGA